MFYTKRNFLLVVAMLSGWMLFANNVFAELILGDEVDVEGISGFSGSVAELHGDTVKYNTVTTPYSYYGGDPVSHDQTAFSGINKLLWEEDSDRPCYMVLTIGAISVAEATGRVEGLEGPFLKTNNICKGGHGNKKEIVLPKTYFARGVQVCTTNKKSTEDNRLKGIRLFTARVLSDGTVSNTKSFEGDQHTNCDVWRKSVVCPADSIVSTVKLYYRNEAMTGKTPKKKYIGMGIKCRKVIKQN